MAMLDIQNAIYTWVSGQIALTPSPMPTIWMFPNAPRPPLPYVGLSILSLIRMGKDTMEHVENDGKAYITALHIMMVNLSCYHIFDGSNMMVIDTLDYLRLTLTKPTVTNYLNSQKITLINANSTINYLPAHIATGFEPRATMDIHFGVTTSIIDDVGLVENVVGKGVVKNSLNNVNIDYSVITGD